MRCTLLVVALAAGFAAPLSAQSARPLSAEAQVASAVAPLPEEFRASATVLGYRSGARTLSSLRQGDGPFICLASDPAEAERFHVACYHRSLEPFMARGREIRADGPANVNVDSIRYAEVEVGRLKLPDGPAALYSLTGTRSNVTDAGVISGARHLFVVYVPYATAESTGLSTMPSADGPWLMNPGTPKAHIMFVPRM
jgi:hypothetical protein